MMIERSPLTRSQHSLYRHNKFYPGDTAYNLTYLTLVSGRLDVERLRTAMDSVVDSSDTFKLDFVEEAGTAYRRVDHRRRPQVTVVNRPEGVPQEEYVREIHAMVVGSFVGTRLSCPLSNNIGHVTMNFPTPFTDA